MKRFASEASFNLIFFLLLIFVGIGMVLVFFDMIFCKIFRIKRKEPEKKSGRIEPGSYVPRY